jgi:hypothetical protein
VVSAFGDASAFRRAGNDRRSAYGRIHTIIRDIPINVGGVATGWNPLSGSPYWTDNDFGKPVANFVAKLI